MGKLEEIVEGKFPEQKLKTRTHLLNINKHSDRTRIASMNVGNLRTRDSIQKLISTLNEEKLI